MPPGARGGRGGRGGFSGARPGTVKIGGVELQWDLSGLDIQKGPAERFPKIAPPQPPKPTEDERAVVRHYLSVRERIHEGPFYTILNDGMSSGLKRKANEPAPSEAVLFNPFTDNTTYSAKYIKVRRRIPKLDSRPYVTELFPAQLHSLLTHDPADERASKRRKVLQITKGNVKTRIDRLFARAEARQGEEPTAEEEEVDPDDEQDEEEKEEDTPDQVDEEDNWSKASSDSEESGDDYNAEQYFDNGEDDVDDDVDPYENTYD